jgi:endonuclease G
VPRKECFERDNSLQISPMPIQYQNSGFDLGHMCDCEDLSYSVLSQRETFILSNIVPQIPFFNRIIWAKLERETRKQVKETQNDHWVLAASVYDENCSKLQNITIPKLFEKIVVNLQTGNTKCYSFPHESLLDKNLSNFFVSSLTNLLVDI